MSNVRFKSVVFMSVLFFCSSIHTLDRCRYQKGAWRTFADKYIPSFLVGAAIGTATGSITRYFDKMMLGDSPPLCLWIIMSWYLEMRVREKLLEEAMIDMDESCLVKKPDFIINLAWISSWIAYLRM